MKKLIAIILLTASSSLFLTACTEEDVKPNQEGSSLGIPSDPA